MANTEDGPGSDPPGRNPRETRPSRPSGFGEKPRASRGDSSGAAYPQEERYWTDYLRVALPVLGLLLLVGLLWYWASAIIGDNKAEAPAVPSAIAMVTPIAPATPPPAAPSSVPILQPTPGLPGATAPAVGVATQPMIVQPTAPAAPAITPVVQATAPPADADAGNPCAGLTTYEVGTSVSTTDEVNLRDAPSTDGVALRVLPAGTQLTISGESVEAGQCDWYPVEVADSGEAGFVIEQYVRMEGQ
ncbi:MAG: SH3 domain-containing protein [Thermomicrobiales bacterium]